MTNATGRSSFKRSLLPSPSQYYRGIGLRLTGGLEWKHATCPLHPDPKKSLLIRLDTGAYRCTFCGEKGRDVLAFEMRLKGIPFVKAAQALGAWGAQ